MTSDQNKLKVHHLQNCKLLTDIPHRRSEHAFVKRQRNPRIPHQQVHRKRPHPPPIMIRGHKRPAHPRHRQGLTSSPRPSSPTQLPKSCQSPQIRFVPSVLQATPKTTFPIPQKGTEPAAGTSPSHHSSSAKSAPPAPSRHTPTIAKPPTATHSIENPQPAQK